MYNSKFQNKGGGISSKISVIEMVMMACIFLSSMNFINRYYFCIYIGFIVFLAIPGRRISVDSATVCLMLLAASMLIFDKAHFLNFLAAFKPFVIPICYLWGRNYVPKDAPYEENVKKIDTAIFLLASGSLVHYLLNFLTNLNAESRNTIDFWTHMIRSATGQATIVCITTGVAIAYFFSDVSLKKKIFAILSMIIIFSYNFILAGRTIIMFALVTCAVAYVYRAISEQKGSLKYLFYVAIIVVIIWVAYNQNFLGLKDIIEDSFFYDRFFGSASSTEFTEDSRLEAKKYYLTHMWEHALGGRHLQKEFGMSAHDLYLDTYDIAGIGALIGVGAYSISSIFRLFKFIRCKDIEFNVRQLVVCVYVIMHMQFWTEPIMAGLPWVFATFCMVDGFIAGLLQKHQPPEESTSKYIKKGAKRHKAIIGYQYKS